MLLTGTPIQNNLQEVYSLLAFIQPNLFLPEAIEDFVSAYADIQTEPALGMAAQTFALSVWKSNSYRQKMIYIC